MEIKVYPNPFVALGPDGMPCGRVLVEPGHPRPFDILGGKLERVRLDHEDDQSRSPREKAMARKLDRRDARVRGVAKVRMRPLTVRPTQYLKERIGSGDLIAADKATYAALFGRGAKGFLDPFALLKAEMTARINEWQAINGEAPALAGYALVQNGDDIALVAQDAERSTPEKAAKASAVARPL